MPSQVSAGLLLYRQRDGRVEVLLAHPGGPFFRNKDAGAWTVPKGLPEPGEALSDTARREFAEEMGVPAPEGPLLALGEVKQKSGKVVHGFAVEGDLPDDFTPRSNLVEIEWPPRSGRRQSIPEIDRAGFFAVDEARRKLNPAQVELLDRLLTALGATSA